MVYISNRLNKYEQIYRVGGALMGCISAGILGYVLLDPDLHILRHRKVVHLVLLLRDEVKIGGSPDRQLNVKRLNKLSTGVLFIKTSTAILVNICVISTPPVIKSSASGINM
jgi:hypothetical protein